jgi:transketolase
MKLIANDIRKKVLEMCFRNGGHISTSFSCVEILVALYFSGVMKYDAKNPNLISRDVFILSKGHGETVLYAILAKAGFFPTDWLDQHYRSGKCILGGHVDSNIPGVEVTTGALGHGLGICCGMAYVGKQRSTEQVFFVLLGDAECSEGSVWEAALFASQHKLGNLVAIIDLNGIGSLDYTKNYISLEPIADKWRSFGWNVIEVDGHNLDHLQKAFTVNPKESKPLVVIAKTVKGKGVAAFENDPIWHVKPVTKEFYEAGMKELSI